MVRPYSFRLSAVALVDTWRSPWQHFWRRGWALQRSMSSPPYSPPAYVALGRLTIAAVLSSVAMTLHAQGAAFRPPVPGAPSGVTAFVGVNVLPMDRERILPQQTVLVKDGWVTALGPSARVKVPAGAVQIDGRGKYLMPGLNNCYYWNDVRSTMPPGMDASRLLESQLLTELAHGVTGVRVVEWNSAFGERFVGLRKRAAAGELLSPRIYTSGQLWGRFDSLASPRRSGVWAGPTTSSAAVRAEDVAGLVAAYKAKGFDYIRYHDEFSLATPEGRVVWDSLAAAARRANLPIAAHMGVWWDTSRTDTDDWLLRHLQDVRSIDGLEGFTPFLYLREVSDTSARVVAGRAKVVAAMKRAGTWSCPSAFTYIDPGTVPLTWPEPAEGFDAELWAQLGRRAARWRALVKEMDTAGMGVLYGTGRLYPSYIHGEVLSLVGGAGLTPYQALVTATRNAAAFFGTLDSAGTVAVGKRADLVLFDYNPLDLARYRNLEGMDSRWPAPHYGLQPHPAGVMLGGRWLPFADLEKRLVALGAREAVYSQP